ncbi:sodium-dependent multivitamin transporter-like [Mercenaria mercenaria]|uniref:sodium-dependent multivitamin transporter-like n=1 Tax=Mercenaria mercenaria TaxID=6596 RepID=UPI00234F6794|nr:sodium-dependent multivitamin transporter-like [Mercenaria mercenaria]
MASGPSFHWADYLIFILVLVISTAIGIFFAWRDRKKQNAADFLLGGRKMGILPVSLSLMATLLSAVMVLGVPAEVYYNGAIYWLILFSNIIVYPVAAHMFLPVYHNLGITSAYEYLEMRFNPLVRILGCIVFQIQMTLSMSMGLFAPAIALNQVMNIDMLISILVIGAICTFYTAIGGLKAVMWTDTFQMLIIMGGFIAVLVQGSNEVGGFNVIWETAKNGSKLDIGNFDPSPLERHTFWTLVIGGGITTLTVYAGNQAMIQRYLSMESIKKAQIALYLQLPAGVIVTTIFVYAGLLLFAKYPVDPMSDCTITLPDQLIPWLVVDVLGDLPGLPGVLLACIFSASLSTVSSGINAISLVFMADIVQPAYMNLKGKAITEPKATIISKIIAFISGGVTIGLAFIAELFGDLILQVALSIYGMIGGPLLGLFVCAMFIPMVNEWGAVSGLIVGLAMSSWLSVGSIIMANDNRPPSPVCAASDGVIANMTNMTSVMTTVTTTVVSNVTGPVELETMSAFAVCVVIIVAVPVSCLTGGTRKKPVDPKLLSPFYHTIVSFSSIMGKDSDYKDHNGLFSDAHDYTVYAINSDRTSEKGLMNNIYSTGYATKM